MSVVSCGKRLEQDTRKKQDLRFSILEIWDPCIFGIRVLAIVHLRFVKKSHAYTLIGQLEVVFVLVSSLLVIFIKEIKSFTGRLFRYFRSKIQVFREKKLIFEVFWLDFGYRA